jgi:hypothetical protein
MAGVTGLKDELFAIRDDMHRLTRGGHGLHAGEVPLKIA